MKEYDEVNHPKHYMLFPDMEAIDVIQAVLTPEEFRGYCRGNALKYRLRAGDKGPAEKCISKSRWYQNRLSAVMGGEWEDAPKYATHKVKAKGMHGFFKWAYLDADCMRECSTQYKLDMNAFEIVATRNQ